MVPTYLPTSARHLDFNNLVGSYDGGPAGYPELRGWGELAHPSGPVASVPSGSWAAPTSPPSQPHNAEEPERPHEDSVTIFLRCMIFFLFFQYPFLQILYYIIKCF